MAHDRIKQLVEDSGGDRFSIGELAQAAGFHDLTIRRYISEGRIKSIKIGGRRFIRREDALEFLKGVRDI